MIWAQVALAYIVDLAFGDPIKALHPVVLMGRLISILERLLYSDKIGRIQKRLRGALLVVIVVAVPASVSWGVVWLAMRANETLGFIVSMLIISTAIATRGLIDSGKDVAAALKGGDLTEARQRVGRIVGRDTDAMKRRDVVRATIESVAENSVDGVIAPIIYALIGGAPLAIAYKAVNTLDSMIGYKNERYEDFGWAAARLDDVLNYIPARISVLIIGFAAFVCRRNAVKAIRVAIRDGRNHASPNSGLPEAAVAGACGIRLGGTNYYGGVARKTGFIGDEKGALTDKHINDVVWLVFVASALTILAGRAVIYAIDAIQVLDIWKRL